MIDNMAAARRRREQWGYIGRGGVIMLFDGEVQCWVSQLRKPEHWQPGRIAVDEEGKSDQRDIALTRLPNDPILS
jgi:hypothetical protein